MSDSVKIVTDKEIAKITFTLNPREQLQNPTPSRDVKRGCWLIENDELWLDRESAGDADSLALPAT